MALPVAHIALALGLVPTRDRKNQAMVALVSILPDFDFLLVWGAGWSRHNFHRTFTHSLSFALAAAFLWHWLARGRWRWLAPAAFFLLLASHGVLDILCTADVADHGVPLFWPWSGLRLGWPILVPLYRLVVDSPFHWQGALASTLLEAVLAWPLWALGRGIHGLLKKAGFDRWLSGSDNS